jgi:hypothetical protein
VGAVDRLGKTAGRPRISGRDNLEIAIVPRVDRSVHAHGFPAKSRVFALLWSSTHMCGFNCPSILPVFQVEEASRRISLLSKSCGCAFSAIVALISQRGAVLFKETISASTTFPV